jgi:hypothetical protein
MMFSLVLCVQWFSDFQPSFSISLFFSAFDRRPTDLFPKLLVDHQRLCSFVVGVVGSLVTKREQSLLPGSIKQLAREFSPFFFLLA